MKIRRRRFAVLLPALLAMQGCANLQGGPTESPDLPNMVRSALPQEGRNATTIQRVEWGRERSRVMPLHNPFMPIMSEHPAEAGVLAATDRGVYFLSWKSDSSSYGIAGAWSYSELAGAELRRFGGSRTVVLRRKAGTVDAFWLMKNRYV